MIWPANPEKSAREIPVGYPRSVNPRGLPSITGIPQNMDLTKVVAKLVGHRHGMASAICEHIADPDERERVRDAVLSVATDEEAHLIGRRACRAESKRLERDAQPLKREMCRLNVLLDGAQEVADWAEGPLTLRPITESQFHRITTDNTELFTRERHPLPPEIAAAQADASGVFLVQHDWASLFEGADVDAGGFRLPFDYCCFEFEITDRRVCALVACDDGEPYRITPIVRAKGGWLIPQSYAVSEGLLMPEGEVETDNIPALATFLMAHIRAIAISLDAEVIETEVIRAPHQQNVSRIKRGQIPVFDHHILSLTRKRSSGLGVGGQTGFKKRLHFRRGHWRHCPNHKTWIKWMMVGDPSLGFADKDYRL